MAATERNNTVDTIRSLALVAICIVNVPFILLPPELALMPGLTLADQLGVFLSESLLQLKFYLLFAFIFGWGLATQATAAKESGVAFKRRYFRRMAALALIGCLHAVLVFNGDILLLYALLGCILWRLLPWPPKQLAALALAMLPLSVVCLTILALALDALPDSAVPLTEYAAPGFWQLSSERLQGWPATWLFLLLLQAPLAFAAFICGVIAAKQQWLQKDSAAMQRLRRFVPWLLLLGLPLNLLFGGVSSGILPAAGELLSFAGLVLLGLAAPAMSAVYLYGLVWLSWRVSLHQLLLRAGQNSLSVYVLQGVLAGWLAGSYGLGLYGQLNQLQLLPVALAVALCAMLLVSGYAYSFGKGPLEQLMKRILA